MAAVMPKNFNYHFMWIEIVTLFMVVCNISIMYLEERRTESNFTELSTIALFDAKTEAIKSLIWRD